MPLHIEYSDFDLCAFLCVLCDVPQCVNSHVVQKCCNETLLKLWCWLVRPHLFV